MNSMWENTMRVTLNDDSKLVEDSFARLLEAESSPARIRGAEAAGHDPALWSSLVAAGAPTMRTDGMSLLDAVIVAEQVGRHLASVPLIESIAVTHALGRSHHADAPAWLDKARSGNIIISAALAPISSGTALIAGGGVADAVMARDADALYLVTGARVGSPPNMGNSAYGYWTLDGSVGTRIPLATGDVAKALHTSLLMEWKLLTAAALAGAANRALELAASYACERVQFDQLIGSFQGLAHPLADRMSEVQGAQTLVRRTVWAIASGQSDAAAMVSMAYWWATQSANKAVAQALRTFGGYGLTLEYDVQLYYRRIKTWPLAAGDPEKALQWVASALWDDGAQSALPPAGAVDLEYDYGAQAKALGAQTRQFFEQTLTPELKAHAHHSWEGHHPVVQKKLAEAGLLFPAIPVEFGGRGLSPVDVACIEQAFHDANWTRNAIGVSEMVAMAVAEFGTDAAKAEALPRILGGEAICSLGITEPSSGSDAFAAKLKAVKDGDDWLLNGQKMFTSGANIADYVLMIARTNTEVPKHKGLTLFLVPLNLPGVSIQAVHTLPDERTNITFYTDVRVPDRYRLGPVDGGARVLSTTLGREQGPFNCHVYQQQMLAEAVAFTKRKGKMADPIVRARLARVAVHANVSLALFDRGLADTVSGGPPSRYFGPISKLFATESYQKDAADLFDLTAPDSMLLDHDTLAAINLGFRHGIACSIYGGTSEVMRSLIAEQALGLPRTRS
jgi:3-oxochol-4-en-24-oyl-CoA dehydrogenase